MKLKYIFNFVLLSFFVLPSHFPLFAQTAAQPNPFVINFDYARFRHSATHAYLELYYSFYCGQITFHSEGTDLKGGVAIRTDLTQEGSGKSVINERVVLPVVMDDTSAAGWRTTSILRQAGHLVPFGNYRLHVVAYDSANPAHRDSLSMPVEIKAFATVSDLQLCASIQASTNTSHPYFKNAHEVTPHPSLVFGAFMPVVYAYTELYDVDTSKVYAVDYEIIDADGAVAKKVSRQRRYRTRNTVEVSTLNAVALKPGKYTLRLNVQNSPSQQKEFYVYQLPSASVEPAPNATSLAVAIETLTEKEIEEEFQKAKYLADKTETSFFSQLKTAPAKKEFLKEFWSRLEAGSATETPRPRTDYLRRVQLADERYSQYTKKGWRTDRGRVFILYGKPDEVERHPSEGVTKPYEVWYFYQIENGVQFVFVDRNGFGDYELVHSTKRNELSDEDWRRYLQ
jgi:GWxTD domain-containing protein